jgi:hypothetical protein
VLKPDPQTFCYKTDTYRILASASTLKIASEAVSTQRLAGSAQGRIQSETDRCLAGLPRFHSDSSYRPARCATIARSQQGAANGWSQGHSSRRYPYRTGSQRDSQAVCKQAGERKFDMTLTEQHTDKASTVLVDRAPDLSSRLQREFHRDLPDAILQRASARSGIFLGSYHVDDRR